MQTILCSNEQILLSCDKFKEGLKRKNNFSCSISNHHLVVYLPKKSTFPIYDLINKFRLDHFNAILARIYNM